MLNEEVLAEVAGAGHLREKGEDQRAGVEDEGVGAKHQSARLTMEEEYCSFPECRSVIRFHRCRFGSGSSSPSALNARRKRGYR